MTNNYDGVEARLRRIETALVLLCKHLGLNPRTGDRLAGDIRLPLEGRHANYGARKDIDE